MVVIIVEEYLEKTQQKAWQEFLKNDAKIPTELSFFRSFSNHSVIASSGDFMQIEFKIGKLVQMSARKIILGPSENCLL